MPLLFQVLLRSAWWAGLRKVGSSSGTGRMATVPVPWGWLPDLWAALQVPVVWRALLPAAAGGSPSEDFGLLLAQAASQGGALIKD